MNEQTRKYIERLPESARGFARAIAEGKIPTARESTLLETTERSAIRGALNELREFDKINNEKS